MSPVDPYDFHAAALPSETIGAIDRFWSHFSDHIEALDAFWTDASSDADPVDIMSALHDVSPDLMWEFGSSDRRHKVVITAEWQDDLRPLARAILRRAPQFERFEVTDTRDPVPVAEIAATYQARFREDLLLTGLDASVGTDARIAVIGYGTADTQTLTDQVLYFASLCLGEQDERDWMGYIDIEADNSKRQGLMSRLGRPKVKPMELAPATQSLVDAISLSKEDRPILPYSQIGLDAPVSVFMKPPTGFHEDHVRSDLLTYSASDKRFAQAVFQGDRFASPCHSAHDEWFVCLRVPNLDGALWDTSDRGDIEDAAHEVLARNGLGGLVGGGTGTEACYIDVALTDVPQGLAVLVAGLRNMRGLDRAEVLFLDVGLTGHAHPFLGATPMSQ
ncbi:MAG: hypothetical protein ABJ246_11020 [Paracoccaceae bacterium]